jgi:Bacterial tandem repeat domain 1
MRAPGFDFIASGKVIKFLIGRFSKLGFLALFAISWATSAGWADGLPAGLEGDWINKETGEQFRIEKGGMWFHPTHGRGRIREADDAADIKIYYDGGGTRCSYRLAFLESGNALDLIPADNTQNPDYCPSGLLIRAAGGASTGSPVPDRQATGLARPGTSDVGQALAGNVGGEVRAREEALFAAVWEKSSAPAFQAWYNLTAAAYEQKTGELAREGFRLRALNGYAGGGEALFAAIWEKDAGPAIEARYNLTAAQYEQTSGQLAREGFRLLTLSGYAAGAEARFAAIWEKSSGPGFQARPNLTAAQYEQTYRALASEGYRPRAVSGYAIGSEPYFAAIWEKSSGPAIQTQYRLNLTAAQYEQTSAQLTGQGFRLGALSAYAVGGEPHFAAIWEKDGGPAVEARESLTATQFQRISGNLAGQGFRLRALTGYEVPRRNRQEWHAKIARTPLPRKGCFEGAYPSQTWLEVPCMPGPVRPNLPAHGLPSENVGNGTYWAAVTTNLISSAVGSFDSVTGVSSETGQIANSGPQVANSFSLQLNTNRFKPSLCNGAVVPANCQGWQQFVFGNPGCAQGTPPQPVSCLYMQYWLINYGPTCPSATWQQTTQVPNACFFSTAATGVSTQVITSLANLTLTAKANPIAGASDAVLLSIGTSDIVATNQDSALALGQNWRSADFNVFGDCCLDVANFNSGSTLTVRLSVDDGTKNAPKCVSSGFTGDTGETNNLTYDVTPAVVPAGTLPAIVFTEAFPASGKPATCTASAPSDSQPRCVQAVSSGSSSCTDAGGTASTCATASCPPGLILVGAGGACAAGDRKLKSIVPNAATSKVDIMCEQQGVEPQAVAVCCR